MPCFTVQEVSIALDVSDFGLLTKALQEMGVVKNVDEKRGRILCRTREEGAFEYRDGKLKGENVSDDLVRRVKRAYSMQVVQTAAKRNGWKIDFRHAKTDERGQVSMKATKGGW